MKRLFFFIVLTLFISVLSFGREPGDKQNLRRPNVLFIAVDDLRTSHGDFNAITPNIDRLAKKSVVFNRAYSQQAVCGPSRASILTGRRPDETRVWDLKTHFREALPDAITLPQYFKRHGYATRNVGKIYHDSKELQDPVSWSAPEIMAITGSAGAKYLLPENQPTDGSWKKAASECLEVADTAYVDGKVATAAVNTIRELKDSSFFLAVGFRRPHLPFSAPKRYWDLYKDSEIPTPSPQSVPEAAPQMALHNGTELRGYNDIPKSGPIPTSKVRQLRHGYLASVSYIDAQIGRLVDELEQQGLTDNTVIVLWSDHGFHLGELGLWAKTTNFEMDTRVPLIIYSPQIGVKGTSTDALVELVDIYPTLVELAGFDVFDELDGISMVPLLEDPARDWKNAVFSQFPRPWMYKSKPTYMGYSVRTRNYRYTEWTNLEDGSVESKELYHYNEGGLETENLAGSENYRDIEKSLSRLLTKNAVNLGENIHSMKTPVEIDPMRYIFKEETNGFQVYRIPAIVKTNSGKLLVFAEARKLRSSGDSGDIDLVLKRSEDGGESWGEMITVWNDETNTCGNPVPIVDRTTGRVHLLMTWNNGKDTWGAITRGVSIDTRRVFYTWSDDEGNTWNKPKEITNAVKNERWDWYGTGPVHGIQISKGGYKGRLVSSNYYSVREKGQKKDYSHVIYSDDNGIEWEAGESTTMDNVGECTIAELSDGRLMMNMRVSTGGARQYCISEDGGKTWGDMVTDTTLIDPNCQGSMVSTTLDQKHILLFANAASSSKRENMTVKLSTDNGRSWIKRVNVHEGPSAYSDLAFTNDNKIAVVYEGGLRRPYEGIAINLLQLSELK